MAKLACPYCHHVQIFDKEGACENCGNPVSRLFLKAVEKAPPVYLATVGFSQHGKTTYLDSLTTMVENLGKISDNSFHEYLDDHTFNEVRHMRWLVQNQRTPDSTDPQRKPLPLQIAIHNFLDNPVNTLITYDLGGEIFDAQSDIQRYAEPMQHAHTIWLFVSVNDLENPPPLDSWGQGRPFLRSLSDLFSVYRAGMERLGVNLKGRNLLIVYTKADKIVNKLPQRVREYIRNDPYFDIARLKFSETRHLRLDAYAYMQEILAISSELENWTYDIEGGTPFINMVKQSGMNVQFTVTSSIGRQSDNTTDRMIEFRRYRVLDPLIWAIMHNKAIGGDRPVALILDNQPTAAKVYANDLPYHIFEYMASLGNVSTYCLGHGTAVSGVNSRPPDSAPEEETPSLLGPILDNLPSDALVLVVLDRPELAKSGPVIFDLEDFNNADWRKRIAFLCFQDGLVKWERTRILQQFNQYKGFLDELFPKNTD
jgi:hypothetical protein